MIGECVSLWSTETSKTAIISISLSLSFLFLLILKKASLSAKPKIAIIYSHLITLIFPIVLLTTNVGCASVCASCYTNIYHLLALAVPSTLLISTIAGFMVIPAAFVYANRRSELNSGKVFNFVRKNSKNLKINQPRVYILNTSKPVAFSFRNFKAAVFLSIGLFDILKWKELQAVILHELAHIKYKSSAVKLSTFLLRIFSPISILLRFHHNNKQEEKKADRLAIKLQGTDKHITSARKKIVEYENIISRSFPKSSGA